MRSARAEVGSECGEGGELPVATTRGAVGRSSAEALRAGAGELNQEG